MSISDHDRGVLRDLARRVAEIAALPVQAERVRLWKDFNALRPHRPMVLAFPEGGWRDLCTEADCRCADPALRAWELGLRRTIWHHEHIQADHPVTDVFKVARCVRFGDYGLVETYTRTESLGSHVWDAPIKTASDLQKLHPRRIEVDRDETARLLEVAHGLFDGILRVQPHYGVGWPAMLSWTAIRLRGLEQVMVDIYDDPALLHDLMAFLRDERLREWKLMEREGVLALNNGPDDYVGSGGLGCTDELPAEGFDGRVRLRDLWGFGESQEFVLVGPEHFCEFVLQYQEPILELFGLNHYGCCEALDGKWDMVRRHVPRLRRVSVSPWWDVADAAAKLTDKYVFSWKPNPAMICAPEVNWDAVERITRDTIEIARGCCVEIVMKDTHTFCGDPRRIGRWSEIASRLAADAAG